MKITRTKVWTDEELYDLRQYVINQHPGAIYTFQGYLNEGLKNRYPKEIHDGAAEFFDILFCELEDLPLFVNQVSPQNWVITYDIFQWRFEQGK